MKNIDEIRSHKVRDFFIIHKNGYTLFHKAYINSKIDAELLSGFLTAIFALSKEISNNTIQEMNMDDLKFIYDTRNPYIFVLNVIDDVDIEFGHNIIENIITYFEEFISNLSSDIISEENKLARELGIDGFSENIDKHINEALLNSYYNSPGKLLNEIESFLESIFGSLGKSVLEKAIQMKCKRRNFFKIEDLKQLNNEIEDLLAKKSNREQAKLIVNQIRDTFELKS